MKFSHIFFDLDGVLIHSEHLYTQAKQMTLSKYGVELPAAEIEKYQGWTDTYFFENYKRQNSLLQVSVDQLVQETVEHFRILHPLMRPQAGAAEFIRQQHSRGVKLANVTSSSAESQQLALKMLGVRNLFEVLVNGDEVENHKPHPEPYLKALKKFGVEVPKVLVIEDSVSGIRSAKAAGLFVCGYGSSFPEALLLEAGADYYAPSYLELRKLTF